MYIHMHIYIYIHIQYMFRRIDCRYDSFLLLTCEFSWTFGEQRSQQMYFLSSEVEMAKRFPGIQTTKPNHQFIRWFSSWPHGIFVASWHVCWWWVWSFSFTEAGFSQLPVARLRQMPSRMGCNAARLESLRFQRRAWAKRNLAEKWPKIIPRFSRIHAPGIDKTLEFMRLLMNSILFIRFWVFVGMHPKFMGDTSFRECQESNTSTAGEFPPSAHIIWLDSSSKNHESVDQREFPLQYCDFPLNHDSGRKGT